MIQKRSIVLENLFKEVSFTYLYESDMKEGCKEAQNKSYSEAMDRRGDLQQRGCQDCMLIYTSIQRASGKSFETDTAFLWIKFIC